MLLILVASLNEVVPSIHERVALQTSVLHSTCHSFSMSFLIPVRSLCVIERFGAEELAVEDF